MQDKKPASPPIKAAPADHPQNSMNVKRVVVPTTATQPIGMIGKSLT